MSWREFDVESLSWLNGAEAAGQADLSHKIDPYLIWAALTNLRGFANQPEFENASQGESWVSILGEADDPRSLDSIAAHEWLAIPPEYLSPIPGASGERSLYFTARVKLKDISRLRAVKQLRSWELGLPVCPGGRMPFEAADIAQPNSQGTASQFASAAEASVEKYASPATVIGVIDYGCAFMNPQFQTDDGHSRIAQLWDQGVRAQGTDDFWDVPPAFNYGRYADRSKIDAELQAFRASQKHASPLDELAIYRRHRYLLSDDTDVSSPVLSSTHGTHVLDVMAGRLDPLSNTSDEHASKADIVFVQLPRLTATDSSGGSLGVHVLDGIRYILRSGAEDAKVVVNLSYGTLAGPHDGSTLLERAMDDLLAKRDANFTIVLAAGNERQLRGHASATLTRDKAQTLQWKVFGNDPTDSFVEIWYAADDESPVTVEVRAPDDEWSGVVGAGHRRRLDAPNGICIAAISHELDVPNGRDRLILVAQAQTETAEGAAELDANAPAGVWEIRLSTGGDKEVQIDAWIERDDSPSGGPTRQSIFPSQASEPRTLNCIATGSHTIVVGGCRRSDGQELGYSGHGPSRGSHVGSPSVLAACEENEALRGIRAAAVKSGAVHRMNGTSVAAPVLARQLFNAMCGRKKPIARKEWATLVQDLIEESEAKRTHEPERGYLFVAPTSV